MPTSYTIPTHLRGDTWGGLNLTITDASGDPLGVDLSGVKMQVRDQPNGRLLLDLSSANGDITFSASGWTVSVLSRIVDIPEGTNYYDIQTETASGDIKTYLSGLWAIEADITR